MSGYSFFALTAFSQAAAPSPCHAAPSRPQRSANTVSASCAPPRPMRAQRTFSRVTTQAKVSPGASLPPGASRNIASASVGLSAAWTCATVNGVGFTSSAYFGNCLSSAASISSTRLSMAASRWRCSCSLAARCCRASAGSETAARRARSSSRRSRERSCRSRASRARAGCLADVPPFARARPRRPNAAPTGPSTKRLSRSLASAAGSSSARRHPAFTRLQKYSCCIR